MLHHLVRFVMFDLCAARRRGGAWGVTLSFFLIGVMVYMMFLNAMVDAYALLACTILWLMAAFAALLTLDSLFVDDRRSGLLEQLLMPASPFASLSGRAALVAAKAMVHWLQTGLPLLLVAPVVALFFGIHGTVLAALLVTLALGTPSISLLGACLAALTCDHKRHGMLLVVLAVPLLLPTFIFAISAIYAAFYQGAETTPHLMLLAAQLLFFAVACPVAGAVALGLLKQP